MKTFALTLALAATCCLLRAQTSTEAPVLADLPDVGAYDRAWFDANPYAADSSVHAYVITKRARGTVRRVPDTGLELMTEHRRIVRVLDRQGTDEATVRISYYKPRRERTRSSLRDVRAITYKRDGNGNVRPREVAPDKIYRNRLNEYWEELTLSFEGVSDGSVLDLSYKTRSGNIGSPAAFYLQEGIPVREALASLRTPSTFAYSISSFGVHPIETSYTQRSSTRGNSSRDGAKDNFLYAWANDLPAMRAEPFVTSINNYRAHVRMELDKYAVGAGVESYTTTWNDIADQLREQVGVRQALSPPKAVKKLAEAYDGPAGDVTAAYDWAFRQVATRVRHDGYVSTYHNERLGKALDAGQGNTAELNLLLVSLCRALGLEAYPVYISPRGDGLLYENAPSRRSLSTVITAVRKGNKYVFADVSAPATSPGLLPEQDLNYRGLLVDKALSEWVDLQRGAMGISNLTANLALDEAGHLHGDVKLQLGGYGVLDYLEADGAEVRFDLDAFEAYEGFEFADAAAAEQRRLMYDVTASVRSKSPVPSVAGFTAISPAIDQAWTKNPFDAESRNFPVEFPYGRVYNRTLNITLPPGATVASLPADLALQTADGKSTYRYVATEADGVVTLATSMMLRKQVYAPQEYFDLRELFAAIAKKEAEQLSLTLVP